jgi:hypothetical protein
VQFLDWEIESLSSIVFGGKKMADLRVTNFPTEGRKLGGDIEDFPNNWIPSQRSSKLTQKSSTRDKSFNPQKNPFIREEKSEQATNYKTLLIFNPP